MMYDIGAIGRGWGEEEGASFPLQNIWGEPRWNENELQTYSLKIP